MPLDLSAIDAPAPPSAFVSASRGEQAAGLAPKRKGLNPFLAAMPAAAQAFDAYTTHQGLMHGAREANPILEPFANNQAAMYATKIGLGALEGFLADRLARAGHPTAAKLLTGLEIGVPLAAGVHNLRMK